MIEIHPKSIFNYFVGGFLVFAVLGANVSCLNQNRPPSNLDAKMQEKESRLKPSGWQRHSQADLHGNLIDSYSWQLLDRDKQRNVVSVWIKTNATGALEYLEYDCQKQKGQIIYTIKYQNGNRIIDRGEYDLSKTESARSFHIGNFQMSCNT